MSTQSTSTHMFILTLEKPGVGSTTHRGTLTLVPGATEYAVLQDVLKGVLSKTPSMREANIVFWLLKPNQL